MAEIKVGEDKSEMLLKPGEQIRPEVSEECVRRLAERLYGISCLEVTELKSYDDRNFFILRDSNVKNPLIVNKWPHGYVMKITNALDSQKLPFVEAQIAMMVFLADNNIKCPKPVKNVFGKYYSSENISSTGKNVVRLLEYQPGKILHEVPPSDFMFFQVGEYIANLDKTLKNFTHPACGTNVTIWMLQSFQSLDQFTYVLKDVSHKEIVEQVLKAFTENVLPYQDDVEKGPLHGDFNEQNILVTPGLKEDEFRVAGVIDFGDIQYSCLVYELAIAMTYMMLQTGDLNTGGLVMSGYSTVRSIPESELKMLKTCIAARLCQSLVLGAYTHTVDPGNNYLLTTQKTGWELLEQLWKEPENELQERWCTISENYLKASSR